MIGQYPCLTSAVKFIYNPVSTSEYRRDGVCLVQL